jgi:uncharacterized protein YcfJ
MKRIFVLVVCVALVFLTCGCQSNKTRTAEGAVIGGVLGATAGGIIGHQSHHGAEGAGIGAAVGAIAGGIIGSQIEKPGQATSQAAQPPSSNQMTLQQIVDLSKQGVNEDVIIGKIRQTNSRFTLTQIDIDYLKEQGVSQKVIDAMQGK